MSESRLLWRARGAPDDAEEQEVRELLRAAGPRAGVPADDLERIRSAARAEWLRRPPSRRPARPSRVALTAALVAGLLLVAGATLLLRRSGRGERAEIPCATLARSVGEVRVTPAGRALLPGSEIATGAAPASGLAALAFAGGRSVRLDAGSAVRLRSGEAIELLAGALYVDAGPGPAGRAFEVVTPAGSVREAGTRFEVRLGRGGEEVVRVRVREGAVALHRSGAAEPVAAGEQLAVARDGAVRREPCPPDGPLWSWVLDSAPSFEIEGRRLDELLDWVARETGWTVRFEAPGLEAAAREIRLHGSIEGVRADRAVEVVLPGTGLVHRVESGVLWIAAPVRTPR